jgi:transcriptional regulator with XRE-family HTH domain
MKKMKTYQSVSQMVRETTDNAFADSFDKRVHRRRIVKDLMVLRAGRGLTQGDVAEKMRCTQSRISKLESSEDFDLTIGDLARYAGAIGFRVNVMLEPQDTTSVRRVKKLAFQIKEELDRLVGLARDDQKIAQGVAGFFNEAFFNLVKMLQDSAKKLPCHPEDGELLISFEIIEDAPGEKPDADSPVPAPATNPVPAPGKEPRKRGRPKPVGA